MTTAVPLGPARIDPHLRHLLRALHPAAGEVGGLTRTADAAGGEAYLAVPSAATARFLLPDAPARTLQRILTSHLGLRDPRTRWQRRALAVAARSGLLARPRTQRVAVRTRPGADDDSFLAHLRNVLDEPALLAAIGVPDRDAHYKPTLQLFGAGGDVIGFAKLGWTPSTAALVRAESTALRALDGGSSQGVRAPRALATGSWLGSPFLVTEPLPLRARRATELTPLRPALRTTAQPRAAPLATGPYGRDLIERVQASGTGREDPRAEVVTVAARTLLTRRGDERWTTGRWHGDWVPWNVAVLGDEVWAFDWEHSRPDVPLGLDELHWHTSSRLQRPGRSLPAALTAARTVTGASTDLVLAYLLELGLRAIALEEVEATSPPRTAVSSLYPGVFESLVEATSELRAADP